jgi:DNA-directed RNA polymerase subunit M/transcription elongation factor TFIIS
MGEGKYLYMDQYKHSREIIRNSIMNLCSNWKQWPKVRANERNKIVEDIEQGCWKNAINIYKSTVCDYTVYDEKFDNFYQSSCRKIMLNLYPDENGNVLLLSKIISKELNAADLGSKKESEMLPEASADIRHEWEMRQSAKIKKNYVTGKKCPKCKTSDKIDFSQAQKAALDDGYLSTGYICENCNYSWS